MAEPEDEAPPVLLPCSVCSRTFKPESLQKHLKVCEKQASKKRKVFDSSKQRIQGTELAEFLPKILREKKTEKVVPKKPESNWKEKHLEFVAAIRAARGVEPVPTTKSSSAVSKSSNEKCPHCDRNFGPKAFDRHIEWCKEQKARIPKSPASLIQAKERLEARTKYRAPPLAKSKRTLTREKYARVPQHSSKESSPLGSRSAVAFSKPQPQEVKVPETTSRIPGIRNKPKLSSSSPSCTLPSGNTQVKRREPSPSPSKRPFRSGSKTARKGPVKAKKEESSSHASLFTSSCNITKIQPSEERHKAREVKPNPVENRVIARKSSRSVPKPCKRKGDPATNPMGVGAHTTKDDEKTGEWHFPADGTELHEKTISCETHNSLFGESLQVKGTLTQPEDEEDCVSSDNVKRFRTHGTNQIRIKLNDIDVNKENDGLLVSPCSIYQSNCNLVAWKDGSKSKQGPKGRGDSDPENEDCNTTVMPCCAQDDIQTQKLMRRSVKEKIVSEQHSEGRSLKTDTREDERTKFCVDSPRYSSGDAVCQRDIKLQQKKLSPDLPLTLLDNESLKYEEFSSEINKSSDAQDNTCCSFMGDGQKTKTKNENSVISELFLSANEVNDRVDIQQNADYQPYHIDPSCFQEIEGRKHNELHEMKEKFEEKVINEDFETLIFARCDDHCLPTDIDVIPSDKLCTNEGGDHLASSQVNLLASGVDNSTCWKDRGALPVGNEKLSNEKELCVPLQKFPYSFDLNKNTDCKTDIDCKMGWTGNVESEAQRKYPFVSTNNVRLNELLISSSQIDIESVDDMGDVQNSQVHHVKERLSQNLKAFDRIFSASECESSDITIAKFNKKHILLNNVDKTQPVEQDMINSAIEIKILHPDTSSWEYHECSDMLQDLDAKSAECSVARSALQSECSEFSQNLPFPCDVYDFSNELMGNDEVRPECVKKKQETLKGEAEDCINTVGPEKFKPRLNSHESILPEYVPDKTAVSFDVKEHLSLLAGDETQMNVSSTSVFIRAFDEPNNTKINNFVNNSLNGESEVNFPQTTNSKTLENNLSVINIQNLSESSLPDVSPSLKDKNNIKHYSLPESFVGKDSDQQYLGEDSCCFVEEGRFCISHHDICVKSDNQFSIEHENVLIKDSNYDDRSGIPFCKKECLCCHEKDKIQSEVCNVWSSCEEEEPDLFYKFDLPENLICERFVDSPTDRIWDLASQEFIKNVREDSCNINSNLNIPNESYSFEESNSEENKELIEQQKMLLFSNKKRKSIQLKTFNECGSILFRSYFAFHQSKTRGQHLKKIRSCTISQMKNKNRRTSQRSAKKSYNLEEPMAKKRLFHELSIHCEALSDISSKQKGTFRNRTKNERFLNLNNSIQREESKLSLSNSSVTEFDQNSESVYKYMIQRSESLMDASNVENSKNETVFTFHNQLHCNSMEENENCVLKTFNNNIVVVEGLKEAENQELVDEALVVALPLRRESETVLQNINLQRVTSQYENTIRYIFDIMKFFVMSELLCSGALNSIISMYIHHLSNTQCRNKKQSLNLPMLPISDKIQNNDEDLKSRSALQNIPSTVAVFYDIDESLFKENLFSTYVVSHKMNEKYFSSEYETASFHEDQFLGIELLPMDNCKDNNEHSSDIEEEEYKEIKRNSSSRKSNANHEVGNISKSKEMNAELFRDMKSHNTDRQARDKDYEFENEISNHSSSQMFHHSLQNFCAHADTDSCGSLHSVVYELPTEALPPQNFSYEREEDITSCNLFPKILRGFERPQIRNCLDSSVCCECSQEFVDDLEFDLLLDSSDVSHFAFEYVDNNSQLELYPLYSEYANYHPNGIVIKELSEESEEQLSNIDLHGKDNCKVGNTCVSELDKTGFTGSLNVPFAEEKDCFYNLNYCTESKEDFVEANLPGCIEETDFAQTDETHDIQNIELNSINVPLAPGKIGCTSDLAIANVCYQPCELDRSVPLHNRNIFCVNFPSFVYTESDDFDVKIWTSSITIPRKKVSLLTRSFQSSTKKSNGAGDEEGSAKFDFCERLSQNIMVMQQNNDNLFEDTNKRVQENDIHAPKRKISASIFKEEKKSIIEKQFNHPLTSGTNVPHNQSHAGDMSLYDLARNVKGIIQSERSKMSEVQTSKKHKIKSAKEHDMSLLKLVEKWSTKDKILKRPKTYEITSKKGDKQFIQSKQEVPKIHRLPPLSSPPKCCLPNRTKLPRVPKGRLTQKSTKLRLMFRRAVSSSEEVYDPYVSAERQMMELLSQGDFTQLSPRHNKTIPSSHAESSTVFPSFESSHRSAFVRYSPPDLSHLAHETAIPPSLIAEFEDLFIGSQKSNYINDISDVTDHQNQNIHISLSDIGQNLSNNNVDTVQPVRKPSKIRAKMESAALSLQRSVSLMNYENDMKVGTEASSLIQSDGDNNPLPTLTEISSFPFSSPEPPRVFSSSKSHLEKGDADKRINEEAFTLKSESSVSSELFAQLKSHSAGGKFSADSAYGSLNRRSPTHSTGKQIPGKHEEIEGDRLCFMSSSSSESSLPPLCAVQVVKRETSNPSLSPSPPHAVDASPVLQSAPRMSKFCHECGSKYPVSLAKFCCECGVRRLAM